MVNAGSKGKLTNVAQMVACLGQQNVDGKRIPYEASPVAPYHTIINMMILSEARGFVENLFISGPDAPETSSSMRWEGG